MDIVVDSGASISMLPPHVAPHVPIRPLPPKSYTAANGELVERKEPNVCSLEQRKGTSSRRSGKSAAYIALLHQYRRCLKQTMSFGLVEKIMAEQDCTTVKQERR